MNNPCTCYEIDPMRARPHERGTLGCYDQMFWTPPPDHDSSPEAVAARIAAGEERDRRYDIRRNELLELEDEDFRPERKEDV